MLKLESNFSSILERRIVLLFQYGFAMRNRAVFILGFYYLKIKKV
jgi:hypothetical protein